MSAPHFVQHARRLDAQREAEAARDVRRGKFLRALDDSEFEVNKWEADFLGSFLGVVSNRPADEWRWWTPGRRSACDQMMSHYPLS